MKQHVPDHFEIQQRVKILAEQIKNDFHDTAIRIVPIPRGGVPIAYHLLAYLPKATVCDLNAVIFYDKDNTDMLFVDDIIDSGSTLQAWQEQYPSIPFYSLYNKIEELNLGWVVFPWEGELGSIENSIIRTLQFIGEDPNREGLKETPQRIIRSWKELYSGYTKDPKDCFKTFDVKFDELVLLKDVELYSTCEHHMLPFTGRAHIAYIADGRVVGISKLARLLEVFARRLQVQERLGAQVVNTLMDELKPKGAACIIEAKHLCMCARGVNKQHSTMVTSAMRGIFLKASPKGIAARSELMALIKQ